MPLRVLIDLQGAQNGSRFRGIGRVSLQLAAALARNAGEHKVFILLNGLFPEAADAIRSALSGLLDENRFLTFAVPGPVAELPAENSWRRQTAEILREHVIADLSPDALLVMSMVEGAEDDAVTSLGSLPHRVPTAAVLHDLIPLMEPDRYLAGEPVRRWYMAKIDSLRRADLLLAVSRSAADEAVNFLPADPARVTVISAAADGWLSSQAIAASTHEAIRKRLGIERRYLMHSSAFEPRKNFQGLIRAYVLLPRAVRRQYQLLLVCRPDETGREELRSIAVKGGLDEADVVVTGFVPDAELAALYQGCHLFVFPSFHEGFGLPALEAMSCGVPTIGSNATSIPEVIGRTDALFDPASTAAMSALILRALTDDDFYQSLKSHAVAQSAKFSWDETARRTWRGLQDMAARLQATIRGAGDAAAGRHELMEAIAEMTHDHAPTDAEILDLARSIEANEQATNRLRASAAFSGPLTWRIEGPFDSTYSLAVINREAARALTLLGHEIVLHSTEGPGDFAADERFLTRNPDLEAMHRRVSRFPHEAVDVVSRNLYPPRVGDMRGRTNLLHNYAWEESAFPVQWTRWFNEHLNGIGCVSRHVRKTLGDDGVTVPMAVIGNGVDHWDRIDANPSFAVEARRFRFLHVSSCFPRKGIDVLLNAYGEAFTIDDDVSLVIKTFPNPHNDTNALLAAHRSRNARYPHVVLLEGDLSDSDLKALYGDCHALVAPSRAEGFGLPIAEAMLSGLSVIVTGWSGQLDFCNDETAWLVDYSFAPAASHFDLFDSVWAEPDVGHLARTMSVVSRTGPAERQRKSSAARGILLENFQWRDVMARLVLFARSCGSPGYWRTHPPRIGWMSTWHTQCGIASYSEHLLSGFPGPVTVFAPRDGLRVRADGPDCIRSWFSGKQENGFPELTREIERRAVDLLVVQFNYGLFNFRQLDEFIRGQAALRPVIVIMHSTGDPGLSPAWNWTLAGLIPAFSLCQRVLVHSIHDLNALKALGLVANVTLFPHAVLDIAAPPAIAASEGRPQLLCTYGFCLPHKGLIELLHAVALMHRSGTAVRLRLVNAEYPASVSAALIEQIAALVDELELTDHVETHHGYLTDEESCGLLRDADLIVYPYQSTQESASGAVRFGIAVHRPVAVTPLAVFADLGNAVHRLPGVSPADMARGMTAVLSELSMGSDAAKSIESQAEKWRASHTYAALAARLHALCLTALPENMRTHWRFDASSRRVESHVGRIDGRSIRSTTVDGYLASGPKLALVPGSYRVIVTGSCNPSGVADDHVDVSVDGCRRILARLSLDASKQPTIVDGIVVLEERCRDLRVRLFVSGRSEVRVDSIEIARVAAACI